MKKYNDCMEVREDFSAYLDGEMSAEERGPLEAHLAVCAECLREMDVLKRVDVSYRALAPVGAPANFEENVRDAVRTGRVPSTGGRGPVPRWMGPLVAMASAAAVLIIGVLVLEARQVAQPTLQMASAPLEMESKETGAQLMRASPAAALSAAEADTAPAASEKTKWDEFAQPPARSGDTTWEQFAQPAPSAAAEPAVGGREDSDASLAEGLAETDAEYRARAELIGTPPAAPAEESAQKVFDALKDEQTDAPAAPPVGAPAQAGEVISRQKLRSFHVLAGGMWVEEGYDHQPTTPLKRSSTELRELMKKFPTADWNQLLNRSARQVFQMGDAWYDLEATPEKP